ncbi:MAG: RHS repeat-associated core domain-containing protein [Paludibacteraceae bacterium]|nr:RHS repeat-associated core domain-containing protein [Paludibacteraceae bacterium]
MCRCGFCFKYGEVFIEERNGTWNTPYLFNGKELDEETGLYYYGARYLNPTSAVWMSVDPLFEKYVGMSPYNYCAGNPVMMVDPDGRETFILFYADEGHGSNSFKDAAETRKANIEDSYGFNPEKDKVFMFGFGDISEITDLTKKCIDDNKEKYGKTREVGIWSHCGGDGPRGKRECSKYPLSEGSKQMSLEGWASIDFNWSEESPSLLIYGCNSGNPSYYKGFSFARNLSSFENMKNVSILGQSSYGYPSLNPYNRKTTTLRSLSIYLPWPWAETYYVGGDKGKGADAIWGTPPKAKQMNVYKNGCKTKSMYQNANSLYKF